MVEMNKTIIYLFNKNLMIETEIQFIFYGGFKIKVLSQIGLSPCIKK